MRQVLTVAYGSAVAVLLLLNGKVARSLEPQTPVAERHSASIGEPLAGNNSLHGLLLAGEVYRPDRSRIRTGSGQGADGYDGPIKKWPERKSTDSGGGSLGIPNWPRSQPRDPTRIRRYPFVGPNRTRTIRIPPSNSTPRQAHVRPNGDLPRHAPVGVRSNAPPQAPTEVRRNAPQSQQFEANLRTADSKSELSEDLQNSIDFQDGSDPYAQEDEPAEVEDRPEPKEKEKTHFFDKDEDKPTPAYEPEQSTNNSSGSSSKPKKTATQSKAGDDKSSGSGKTKKQPGKINGDSKSAGKKNTGEGKILGTVDLDKGKNSGSPVGPVVKWPDRINHSQGYTRDRSRDRDENPPTGKKKWVNTDGYHRQRDTGDNSGIRILTPAEAESIGNGTKRGPSISADRSHDPPISDARDREIADQLAKEAGVPQDIIDLMNEHRGQGDPKLDPTRREPPPGSNRDLLDSAEDSAKFVGGQLRDAYIDAYIEKTIKDTVTNAAGKAVVSAGGVVSGVASGVLGNAEDIGHESEVEKADQESRQAERDRNDIYRSIDSRFKRRFDEVGISSSPETDRLKTKADLNVAESKQKLVEAKIRESTRVIDDSAADFARLRNEWGPQDARLEKYRKSIRHETGFLIQLKEEHAAAKSQVLRVRSKLKSSEK